MNLKALAEARLGASYLHDGRGRILLSNEWDARPAPRFAFCRTENGHAWRVSAAVPDNVAAALAEICAREPLGFAAQQPALAAELRAVLEPITEARAGPAYRFPPTIPDADCAEINAANADLLCGGLEAWIPDVLHRRPFVASLEAGVAAAVCASVRISKLVHEAGVETRADRRRMGHATHAVAGWATRVRALGAAPVYSTAWDNLASQRVAQRLGLIQFGTDFSVA